MKTLWGGNAFRISGSLLRESASHCCTRINPPVLNNSVTSNCTISIPYPLSEQSNNWLAIILLLNTECSAYTVTTMLYKISRCTGPVYNRVWPYVWFYDFGKYTVYFHTKLIRYMGDIINSLSPGDVVVILKCDVHTRFTDWYILGICPRANAAQHWKCDYLSRYLTQCWTRSVSPCGVTRTEWVYDENNNNKHFVC